MSDAEKDICQDGDMYCNCEACQRTGGRFTHETNQMGALLAGQMITDLKKKKKPDNLHGFHVGLAVFLGLCIGLGLCSIAWILARLAL